jgi:hypothetical protein
MSVAGRELVSYLKTEIILSDGPRVRIRSTSLNEDKQQSELMPPFEHEHNFQDDEEFKGPKAPPEPWPPPGAREETITVEAGEFDCIRLEIDHRGLKGTSWQAKKYPGLIVRSVITSPQSTTTELVELVE